MTTAFGLSPTVIEKLRSVFAKFASVDSVIVYGSRALGTEKKGSDIDLTVMGQKMTLTEMLRIESEIDDLLLPYKVDLSLHHQIENPDVLDHIRRVGQILYQRN